MPRTSREPVLAAPDGVAGAAHQRSERSLLDRERVAPDCLHLAEPPAREPGEGPIEPPDEAHDTPAGSGVERVEELLDGARERLRVLEHRRVPALRHEPERRRRDPVEEPDRDVPRGDPVLGAPHEEGRAADLGEPVLEVVPASRATDLEDAQDVAALAHLAPDLLHPLGSDQGRIVEDLRHLLSHELGGRAVRHAPSEAALEETGGPREHQPAHALRGVEREIERDVAAQRVADDDRRRHALRVHERLDVGPETHHREIVRRGLEDGQGQRHRSAARREGLDGRLPVLARAEQAVKAQHRDARPGFDPAKFRHDARLAHAVLPPRRGASRRVGAAGPRCDGPCPGFTVPAAR